MHHSIHRYYVPDSYENYNHLVISGRQAAAIDPFDWDLALAQADRQGVTVSEIWLTHGHPDHIMGVPDAFPGIIRGHADLKRVNVTHPINTDTRFVLGDLTVDVMLTPGHTLDHLCFYCPQIPALLAGDTLFNAGVGNTRSGDTDTLFESIRKLADLPAETVLYNGHDYLQTNLAFSESVVGKTRALTEWQQKAAATGKDDRPTTRLQDEHRINLFFQTATPELVQALALPPEADELTVFRALRARRDAW